MISWSPGDCATAVFVNPVIRVPTDPARRWAVSIADPQRIRPPVTYGVVPPGAQQTIGPFPLLRGVSYVVQVIGSAGECTADPTVGACRVLGETGFTP